MENLAIDLNYVSEAARILTGRSGTAKEKFAKAGQHFWSALIFIESWPPDLAARAQQISRRFLEHGTVEQTAKRLDRATVTARVRELAESVSSLAADIELAKRNGTIAKYTEAVPLRRSITSR